MGDRRGAYRRPEGKNHLKDPGIDGRIILRLILRSGMSCGQDLSS
jgi:hypothetical protein